MKSTLVSVVIVTFLSLIYSGTGLAQEPAREGLADGKVSFNLGADIGNLSGYTLYNIKIPGKFPGDYPFTEAESELEFPLDSWIGGLNASVGKKGLWSIDLSLAKNLTGDTGKTKDSDWLTVGYGYKWKTGNTREKFIYSESDTKMDAFLLDLNGRYGSKGAFLIGGYRYQNFSFDLSNGNQSSPIGLLPPSYVSGKVATYEITYKIPYGGIGFDIRPSSKFSINLLGVYGWANAEDKDDHILRSKRSTAEADGSFYSIKAQGDLSLSKNLSLLAAIEYLKIDANGTQDQVRYAATDEGPAGTIATGIDYKAESEQLYFWAGVKYVF